MALKTQTRRLSGGRIEIVRVLNVDDLAEWTDDDPLAYEKSIVWLEDIRYLPFVRAVQVRCARSRRGRLRVNTGERVIGYSKLLPDAPRDPSNGRYSRRLFYLKPFDLLTEIRAFPRNAVDPRLILPGRVGHMPRQIAPAKPEPSRPKRIILARDI